MSQDMNDQMALIVGESSTGKSASLQFIRDQGKYLYLNTEAGKRLPFQNDFSAHRIEDPYQVFEGFDYGTATPDIKGIIVDSLTFLMDMFETQYVIGATNTMKAWGDYQQFFKILMQDKVVKFGRSVLIMAHTLKVYNEKTLDYDVSVPIKGALKNNGVEAYFSTVVAAKKVSLKELESYGSDLLTISEDDEMLGYKHVFQTRLTKATVGERIRSPMGMFTREQTYMNNDAQLLLDHLHAFYGA
jgi:hypothetical protein